MVVFSFARWQYFLCEQRPESEKAGANYISELSNGSLQNLNGQQTNSASKCFELL